MIVALGFVAMAGLGAVARAQISHLAPGHYGTELATLGINVVGAFALGVLTARAGDSVLTAVGAGGIGALTTYSTFVAACTGMHRHAGINAGALYVTATVTLGIGAAALGLAL